MSADTDIQPADEPGVLTKAYRSVSPRYTSHSDAEMDSVGWAIFLGIVVLLLPLLPLLVIVWVIERSINAVAGRRGGD